jgi:hypothetical protein
MHTVSAMRFAVAVIGVMLLGGCQKDSALEDGRTADGGGRDGAAGMRDSIDCSMVGCGAPPLCGQACGAPCGCCSCGEGQQQGGLTCRGGCWAAPDAGASDLPVVAFQSFRLTVAFGPCPPNGDCAGYLDLDSTGRLTRDWTDRPGVPIGTAMVTSAELSAAITVFTDAELVKLLDAKTPPCQPPTDIFESMEVIEGSRTHKNSTTTCSNKPVAAARDAINRLAEKYLPPSMR